jgi:hypothetical protein
MMCPSGDSMRFKISDVRGRAPTPEMDRECLALAADRSLRLVSDQTIVQSAARIGVLVEPGTDEDEFLAAITPDLVPVPIKKLTELRISRPLRLRDGRPPEPLGAEGGAVRPGNRQQADFVRSRRQPEMALSRG